MKKALIVLTEAYADWEVSYIAPELAMTQQFEINTVSLESPQVTSIGQLKTNIDYTIDQVTEPFDALIIIGGNSWGNLEDDRLLNLIRTSLDNNVVVGAICGAVDYFARNGLLTGFKHTGNDQKHWTTETYNQYINYEDFIEQDSFRDRHLITSNGSNSIDFCFNILEALNVIDSEQAEQNKTFYKLGYTAYKEKYGEIGG